MTTIYVKPQLVVGVIENTKGYGLSLNKILSILVDQQMHTVGDFVIAKGDYNLESPIQISSAHLYEMDVDAAVLSKIESIRPEDVSLTEFVEDLFQMYVCDSNRIRLESN